MPLYCYFSLCNFSLSTLSILFTMTVTNLLPNLYELQRRYWGNSYTEMSSDNSLDDSAAATTNAHDAAAVVGAVSAVDVVSGVHFGEGIDGSPYANYPATDAAYASDSAPVADKSAPDVKFSDESAGYANKYVPETDKSFAHDSADDKSAADTQIQ
jgi:hypothetical protein